MSREIEGYVDGIGGRYKSVAKAPIILRPCEHLVEKEGRIRKEIVTVHGNADGSIKVNRFKV